jgi:tRNA A-37 threonylcarbamoyl transferase component Bud32
MIDSVLALDTTALREGNPSTPFCVRIESSLPQMQEEILHCTEILRFLPGRRLVCKAHIDNLDVVAKIFIHPHKKKHDCQNEMDGYASFRKASILTPEIILHGNISGGGNILGFRYLPGAIVLGAMLSSRPDCDSVKYIQKVVRIVARMHVCGFQQVDLHLNNFLYVNGDIFTIDCGDIASLSTIKAKKAKQIHKNIADILSQLPVHYDICQELFLAAYAEISAELDSARIKAEIKNWRRWRLKNYARKATRNCTEFKTYKSWIARRVWRREYSGPEWEAFCAEIDQHIESGTRLKNGNTATVALTQCMGTKVVVKRYNIKGCGHWLARFWRPSRAWKSWINAQRLKVLGIKTPEPVGVIERRWGWFRTKAYYISLYDPSPDVLSFYLHRTQVLARHKILFAQLFINMRQARISHGDFKANNLLLTEEDIALIDLDAMHFHPFAWRFKRAFKRDLRRFLKNWDTNPEIHADFAQIVEEISS